MSLHSSLGDRVRFHIKEKKKEERNGGRVKRREGGREEERKEERMEGRKEARKEGRKTEYVKAPNFSSVLKSSILTTQ